MLLFWRIRYFDRRDMEFKNRDLYLDTSTLKPKERIAVEAIREMRHLGREHEILRYRHLFIESPSYIESLHKESPLAIIDKYGRYDSFGLLNYFENEIGEPISLDEIGSIKFGTTNLISIPPGVNSRDVYLSVSASTPFQFEMISLTDDQLRILSIFLHDINEMLKSAFMEEGPGSITYVPGEAPILTTSVSAEEISSYVIVFRRIYMKNEPANFFKAVNAFCAGVGKHPLVDSIRTFERDYRDLLESYANGDFCLSRPCQFHNKRLIDIFLNTQYAHQPRPDKEQQFMKALDEAGSIDVLKSLFLDILYNLSILVTNAGKGMALFYYQYCQYHKIDPNKFHSLSNKPFGIGHEPKLSEKMKAILERKATELAEVLWAEAGKPPSGQACFLDKAKSIIAKELRF